MTSRSQQQNSCLSSFRYLYVIFNKNIRGMEDKGLPINDKHQVVQITLPCSNSPDIFNLHLIFFYRDSLLTIIVKQRKTNASEKLYSRKRFWRRALDPYLPPLQSPKITTEKVRCSSEADQRWPPANTSWSDGFRKILRTRLA